MKPYPLCHPFGISPAFAEPKHLITPRFKSEPRTIGPEIGHQICGNSLFKQKYLSAMDSAGFHIAKKALAGKFSRLPLEMLDLSDYSKNYLGFLVGDIWETLGRYEQVIKKALSHSYKDVSVMTLVDYGGGTGLLSLLAKEMGFKSVIYNDIFEGSCDDVAVLARACELKIDATICGDATDLVDYLNKNAIQADLIVSYDVIEHVYDVKKNFQAFCQLEINPEVIVYGSGANIRNPFYTHSVKRDQLSVENKDREQSYGHKPSDSLKSYLNIRKAIITQSAAGLGEAEVEFLGRSTRGLIKSDIEKVVEKYVLTGEFNYEIKHPTNTCDPLTGNWCEHLLEFEWLRSTAQSFGFKPKILKGKYSPDRLTKRNIFRWIFNVVSKLLGPLGFAFSPFYILILKPPAKSR
jgi:SAM-dependent methyltransferase